MHLISRVYATSVKAKVLFNCLLFLFCFDFCLFVCFWDAVSLYTKAGLELNCVTQAGIKLLAILQPQPLECWDILKSSHALLTGEFSKLICNNNKISDKAFNIRERYIVDCYWLRWIRKRIKLILVINWYFQFKKSLRTEAFWLGQVTFGWGKCLFAAPL